MKLIIFKDAFDFERVFRVKAVQIELKIISFQKLVNISILDITGILNPP